jgi:hypothetical protein
MLVQHCLEVLKPQNEGLYRGGLRSLLRSREPSCSRRKKGDRGAVKLKVYVSRGAKFGLHFSGSNPFFCHSQHSAISSQPHSLTWYTDHLSNIQTGTQGSAPNIFPTPHTTFSSTSAFPLPIELMRIRLLSFAGMPRAPVLRSNVTAEGGGARGGFTDRREAGS